MKPTLIAATIFVALASCDVCPAQDLAVREFRRVVEQDDVTTMDRMPWYAGESVGYTVVARRGGDAVEIPDGSVPVWQVLDVATNAFIISTGTVVSATNGEVRFWLPAPQANLPAGNYLSYATVYQGTNRIGVIDRATVRVSWRPGDSFETAQPLTNVLDQVLSWWADAASLVAAASNSLAEAIAAETQAREEAGYVTEEEDPAFTSSASFGITANLLANWNAAYGWGNHASAGYLTGFTETDGVFTASAAYGITSGAISNWNAAYGWGNHAAAGYLQSSYYIVYVIPGIGSVDCDQWRFDELGVNNLGRMSDTNNPTVLLRQIRFDDGGVTGNWVFWGTNRFDGALAFSGAAEQSMRDFLRSAGKSGLRPSTSASVSGGQVTIWCQSNSLFALDLTGANTITAAVPWIIQTNGWTSGDIPAVTVKVMMGSNATWAWPAGCVTNVAAPEVGSTNFYMLLHNGSAWCAY